MTRPPRDYTMSLSDMEAVAAAVCELDAAKGFFIAESDNIPQIVRQALDAITRAMGKDAALVFGRHFEEDQETRPA